MPSKSYPNFTEQIQFKGVSFDMIFTLGNAGSLCPWYHVHTVGRTFHITIKMNQSHLGTFYIKDKFKFGNGIDETNFMVIINEIFKNKREKGEFPPLLNMQELKLKRYEEI